MPKMIFFLIFLLANVLFAGVEVLENSDGRIVARVDFSSFVYQKGADPTIFLNFTADRNSRPQVSATPQNRITKRIPDNLERQTFSTTLSYSPARNIPLFSVGVSPILATNGNEIIYTTEMIVVINYSVGTTRRAVPRSDYYDAVSAIVLNPDKIRNTIFESTRATRNLRDFNTISSKALRFWIGDEPSATNERECDLHSKAGIYRITPADLRELGTNLPINSIRIRSANPNVADSITPPFANLPSGLVEVPVIIRDKNNNGVFDGDDEILFYAEKIHTWFFDGNAWQFLFNYTDFRRYYWITIDEPSVQMARFADGDGGAIQRTGDVYYRGKRSRALTTAYNQSYGHGDKRWVWSSLTDNNRTLSADFPAHFFANSLSGTTQIRFYWHELSGFPSLLFNEKYSRSGANLGQWFSFEKSPTISLSVSFNQGSGRRYLDFDGYGLRYSQNLSMTGTRNLQFYSNTGEKMPLTYQISNLPNEYRLLIRHNPRTQLTELIDSGSTSGTFQFNDSSANGFKYHLATVSGFLSIPDNAEIVMPSSSRGQFHVVDLLNTSNRADYLIVSPADFLGQAIELARHKQEIGRFVSPRVVNVEDIFKTFSGGVYSPEAIRNFMVYTQNAWQKINDSPSPDYLVLFGRGHYDYKNISSRVPNFLPVYISKAWDYSTELISYPIEDFFAYTAEYTTAGGRGALPQIIVGRIPANSVAEADAYLQKIKGLETDNADYSSWRNRPVLVADDDIQHRLNEPETMRHTWQSDSVGIIIGALDRSADIRKVTLFEFPFDNQVRKPLAREALIREINRGVSFVNYFGHGSYTVISDQKTFEITDIALLSNEDRYFIFGAFSCSVGFSDHPTISGLSEMLVRAARRGAVNSISATRTAFTNENARIANQLFRSFYDSTRTVSVGQAYWEAKRFENILTFSLLGDPSYTPMVNRRKISEITILNEKREAIDTLKMMQNILLTGRLPIANDGVLRVAEVILQNPENLTPTRKDGLTHRIHPIINDVPYQYTLPGMIVDRQRVEFRGNSFEIPMEIFDTIPGSVFKIHIHNKNGGTEIFTGVTGDEITFSGFDSSAKIDPDNRTGPTIALFQIFSDSEGRPDTTKNRVISDRITIDGFNSGSIMLEIRISDPDRIFLPY